MSHCYVRRLPLLLEVLIVLVIGKNSASFKFSDAIVVRRTQKRIQRRSIIKGRRSTVQYPDTTICHSATAL